MRWKQKPIPEPSPWRKWFAWYPVEIDGENVWLEWIERYCEGRGDHTAVDYRNLGTTPND